ncbi:MFS transporter [candidate division KSB1 bacterium]|nr:MFS transporter [candidate division KSB1 bacterium]
MTVVTIKQKLATISWILYDFANTMYSMNVVSMYFSTWIVVDLGLKDSYVSYANSVSMILVALSMPIIGEISDRFNKKMDFLLLFTLICVGSTAMIGVAGIYASAMQRTVLLAIIFFIIANYAYQGSLVFYNSLLPYVCSERSIGRVSGYGVAIGYLGSIFGLLMVLPFVEGDIYGLKIPFIEGGGSVASFIPTAILFMLFSVPIFLYVKEPDRIISTHQSGINISKSFRKVIDGLTNTRKYPGVSRFLISKFFYEDAIQTIIIFMAVYAQKVVGFSKSETTTFFIAIIPAAIVGSIIFGILTDHIGPKKTLEIVLYGWIISLVLVLLTNEVWIFWVLGCFIGIFMGSTWTSARPLLISLAPKEMLGEFFGLYSFSGKVAAIVGPLVWAFTNEMFESYGVIVQYKASVASMIVLICIGLFILRRVPAIKINK